MKQRNDTGSVVTVSGIPHQIGPSHVIDLEGPVVGFTPVDDDATPLEEPSVVVDDEPSPADDDTAVDLSPTDADDPDIATEPEPTHTPTPVEEN